MKRSLLVILLMVIFWCNISIADSLANETIEIYVDGSHIEMEAQAVLEGGRILVPIRSVFSALAAQVHWDQEHQNITVTGVDIVAKLTIGDEIAYVNNQRVRLDVPARIVDGRAFIPLRFLSEILDAEISWNERSQQVSIQSNYLISQSETVGKYVLNQNSGKLYFIEPNGIIHEFSDLQVDIRGYGRMSAEKTPQGNVLITIIDNHGGEPKLNWAVHSIYLREHKVSKHITANYVRRFEENVRFFDGTVILTDGKEVYLIDDFTGAIKETYDLEEMGEREGNYFLEGYDEEFLLLRHNGAGLLTLVLLESNEKVLIFEKLFNEDEQEVVRLRDIPYSGDYLSYKGREGNILYFEERRHKYNMGESPEDNPVYQYAL